jgi:hypothetical protein
MSTNARTLYKGSSLPLTLRLSAKWMLVLIYNHLHREMMEPSFDVINSSS